jgi:hypothetical protein
MARGREIMTDWVEEALRKLGGAASILDICKEVWTLHEADIRNAGDLLYEWQYEIRWAGDLLRRNGVIRPAEVSPRGVWELS